MSEHAPTCSVDVEDVIGPIVDSSCLNGFDFTLLFEECFLTIIPLGLTCASPSVHFFVHLADRVPVIWTFFRISHLWRAPAKVQGSWLLASKTVIMVPALCCNSIRLTTHFESTFLVYLALHITLLVIWAEPSITTTRATLPATSLNIVVFALLLFASYLEHVRSIRPSTLMTVYLGISSLLDIARLRTLFFVAGYHTAARIHLAGFFLKLVIFALEVTEKRSLLLSSWQDSSPEAASGIMNRVLFIWLNSLLFKGFRGLLTVDSLTPLDPDILSASRPSVLRDKWQKGILFSLSFSFQAFLLICLRSPQNKPQQSVLDFHRPLQRESAD